MGNKEKKITLMTLVLMIFTSVYGFPNMPKAFMLMGYSGIIWYIACALLYFLPYAVMISEYGAAFREEKGGIYSWMSIIVGEKYAFITTLLWYESVVIWFVNTVSAIWIPLSNGLYGADTTSAWTFFGLDSVQTLGVMGIIFMIVVTILCSRGLNNVSRVARLGGIAIASLNVILIVGSIIVALINGVQTPITEPVRDFTVSPLAEYQSFIGLFSFATFAFYAYGGLEVLGSLVDKTENPRRTFPRGIILATAVIIVGYALGIASVGLSANWETVLHNDSVNLGNVPYIVMQNLGYQLGLCAGLSGASALRAGAAMSHFVGISMFVAVTGAFFTDAFAPLKSLISGAPAGLWPGRLGRTNEHGVHEYAMWIQALVVIGFVALVAFGGKNTAGFYEILTLMNNVSCTLPYILLAYPYVKFKRMQQSGEISCDFKIVNSMKLSKLVSYSIVFSVAAANVFAIIEPSIADFATGWGDSVLMMLGPVVFIVAGLILFNSYEKKNKIKE